MSVFSNSVVLSFGFYDFFLHFVVCRFIEARHKPAAVLGIIFITLAIGCELVSQHIKSWGDVYIATIPRCVFSIVEKSAIQGCAGMLGLWLAEREEQTQGDLKILVYILVLVLLGTLVYISIHNALVMFIAGLWK